MRVRSPFKINDWEIGKFLTIVLSLQLAMWGIAGLDSLGVQIPIIGQLIGFIYITFIPGILILRILKVHNLDSTETLLYTVGLSVAFIMFTGLLINTFYPILGIVKPLSLIPLTITTSVEVLMLSVLSYIRDKDFSDPDFINVENVLSPVTLFICAVPFVSIFGACLMNFYGINTLSLSLVVILGVLILFIGFNKGISRELYPLAVFVSAISLLYNTSLISSYLWGWDIQVEYYLANLVIKNSFWNWSLPSDPNGMLSVVMLGPIYSVLSGMDLIWVFKTIYPFLFSFLALGLYAIFKRQMDHKIAFLSTFFFISTFTFYGELLYLARQQIAELFLVLLVLLLISDMKKHRAILLVVFAFSLSVSHYGLAFIYVLIFILVMLAPALKDNRVMKRLVGKRFTKSREHDKLTDDNPNPPKQSDRKITLSFVILFAIFTFAWYMYVSGASILSNFVWVSNSFIMTFVKQLLGQSPKSAASVIASATPPRPLHKIAMYLRLLTQFFISVGIIGVVLKWSDIKFERTYLTFAVASYGLFVASVIFPDVAFTLDVTRLYHITLIFLAPFCVIGGIIVFKAMTKVLTVWTKRHLKSSMKALSIFFTLFLLFDSGFLYQVVEHNSQSICYNRKVDGPLFNDQEVLGAKWWDGVAINNHVYGDRYRRLLLVSLNMSGSPHGRLAGPPEFSVKTNNSLMDDPHIVAINHIPRDSYIYLGTKNILEREFTILDKGMLNYVNTEDAIINRGEIYDSGGAQLYYG